MYSEIFNQINKANKIAIFMHQTPDGDAFGSALMLVEFVKTNYANKQVCLFAMNYEINPNFEKMLNGIELNKKEDNFDLAIAVDCANKDRFADFVDIFDNAKFSINIDHHQDNAKFADINFVQDISSCSEIIFNILLTSNKPITKRLASVGCAGIVTDTNAFSNPNVDAKTFQTVGKMFELGVDVGRIRELFYSGNDKFIFKLLGVAKTKAEFFFEDKLMIINLTKEDFENCGVEKDNGCLINQLFASSTSKMCALITPRNGLKHISLRSVEGLNVNVIARMLNGGGHICASAGNVDFDVEKIKEIILQEAKKQFDSFVDKKINLFE